MQSSKFKSGKLFTINLKNRRFGHTVHIWRSLSPFDNTQIGIIHDHEILLIINQVSAKWTHVVIGGTVGFLYEIDCYPPEFFSEIAAQ